jgi:hypothetical protein
MQDCTAFRKRTDFARLPILAALDFHKNFLTRLIALNQEQREKPGHAPGFSLVGRMANGVRSKSRLKMSI